MQMHRLIDRGIAILMISLVIIIPVCCVSALRAQENFKVPVIAENKGKSFYSPGQFIHESFLYAGLPLQWKKNDLLKLGAVSAATLIVMPFDENISKAIKGDQRYYNSTAVVGGRIYGEGYFIGGAAVAISIYGMAAHDTGSKKIAAELFQAGVYSAVVTEVLKIGIGRSRPYMNEGSNIYHPFTFIKDGFHSLPGGHATEAIALSTVLFRHSHSTALKILSFIPAGFTVFSRIYQNEHWLSDEIPAAAIGFFTANWVIDLHEGKESHTRNTAY